MSAPQSFGERVYQLLLRLYPEEFREKYARAMTDFQRERVRDARASGHATFPVWVRAFADVVVSALAERATARNTPRRPVMRTLPQDVGYALRGLARRPAFTSIVVATIALGVGANTAIFSVVNGILLRPLPYRDAERIVSFGHEPPHWLSSDPDFLDYQREVPSLEALAAYTQGLATLSSGGEPDRIRAVRVSDDFFRILGVSPLFGRTFAPDEFRGDPPTSVVLSYGLWKRRFGGDTAIVNNTVVMNGVQRVVVGVMPPFFNYPEARSEIWVPMPRLNPDSLGDRANHYLVMVGKFKVGATVERLRSDAKVVAARIMADNPGSFDPKQPLQPHIEVVGEQLVRNARPYLAALLGAVGFVLLIACANVANLLLARAEERRREMAVRSALGASGARLVTQMLTESALLALAGGAIGLAVAWAGNRALLAFAPGTIPRLDEVAIDWRVIAFTLTVSALTGAFIGLVPAWRVSRANASEALKAGGKTAAVGAARGARRMLVVAEVGLAVVALSGAGMLLRSLWRLESVDIGFTPPGALTARLAIDAREYNEARSAVFFEQLIQGLEAVPGVESVGASGWLPVVDMGGLWGLVPEGRSYGPGLAGDQPVAVPQQITPGYLEALGIRLLGGREFTWADREGAPHVAIVSAAMATRVWPGETPIGKRFHLGNSTADMPFMTVVGVAADIRASGFMDMPQPMMYFPYAQTARTAFFMPRAMALIVRTNGDPMALAARVRATVHAIDPTVPVSEMRTLEEVVDTAVSTRRFSTTLLAAFSIVALALAGLGTYGVIAYGVSQRTFEIGVRMALGAERHSVLRLVMLEGIRMCAVGLAFGLVGSLVLGRAIRTLLFGGSPVDAPALMAASVLLLVAAAVASALPARRALAVSPTEALRGY